MHRETNALPPPPPHPARLVHSPSYYLPPRMPSQNLNSSTSPSFAASRPPQVSVTGLPPQVPISHVPHLGSIQSSQSYAPRQSHGIQQQTTPVQQYHNRALQSHSPQPPITSSFPRPQPVAPSIQSSYSLPTAKKARPESMPPLPASSQPFGGVPSFLPPPTVLNQLNPSLPVASPQRNVTPVGTIRRPLPTPSPSKSSPSKSIQASMASISPKGHNVPFSSRNEEDSVSKQIQGSSKRNSRALPYSPISPPDISQIRLEDNLLDARKSPLSSRQNNVASIKSKFEGNRMNDGAYSNNVPMTFKSPQHPDGVRARSLSPIKSNDFSPSFTNGLSRSPSPTSPQYGILDLPSRSRLQSQLDDVESVFEKPESIVYAPSPVRAQRALQSPDIVPLSPEIEHASRSDRDGSRRSNIYKLASTSVSGEVMEAIYPEVSGIYYSLIFNNSY